MRTLALFVGAFLVGHAVVGDDSAPGKPVLATIFGAKAIEVVEQGGTKRTVPEGGELKAGDVIETRPGVTVKVVYDDGSEIVAGRGTRIRIESAASAGKAVTVDAGVIRAMVKPVIDPSKSKPRAFTVRTRAAVMGVRGTDFTVQLEPKDEATSFYAIAGVIEVAAREADLGTSGATVLTAGKTLSVRRGAIGRPKAFDVRGYLQGLHRAQPDMEALARSRVGRGGVFEGAGGGGGSAGDSSSGAGGGGGTGGSSSVSPQSSGVSGVAPVPAATSGSGSSVPSAEQAAGVTGQATCRPRDECVQLQSSNLVTKEVLDACAACYPGLGGIGGLTLPKTTNAAKAGAYSPPSSSSSGPGAGAGGGAGAGNGLTQAPAPVGTVIPTNQIQGQDNIKFY